MDATLAGKTVLVTGGARRIGRALSLAAAQTGARVVIHHAHSPRQAEETRAEILSLGGQAEIVQADLSDLRLARELMERVQELGPLYALVNNAAIFENLRLIDTDLEAWQRTMDLNLTAPFLLCQAFARSIQGKPGRIINILDWRALRPGSDHLPYTISKAGLAALTRSLALALAPHISVNGLALGAILPPADAGKTAGIIQSVPAGRWASLAEVQAALLFLLTGPEYITGEIIHIDGGRHLV